jgi:hypothetical protein
MVEGPARRVIAVLLTKLSSRSESLPEALFVHGVNIGSDRDRWESGGFSDVYRGTLNERIVALKRPRIRREDKESAYAVRPLIPRPCHLFSYFCRSCCIRRRSFGDNLTIRTSFRSWVWIERPSNLEETCAWFLHGWKVEPSKNTYSLHCIMSRGIGIES